MAMDNLHLVSMWAIKKKKKAFDTQIIWTKHFNTDRHFIFFERQYGKSRTAKCYHSKSVEGT